MVTNFSLKSSVLSNAHFLESRLLQVFKNPGWVSIFLSYAPSYRKNDLKNAIDQDNLSVKNSKLNAAFLIIIE